MLSLKRSLVAILTCAAIAFLVSCSSLAKNNEKIKVAHPSVETIPAEQQKQKQQQLLSVKNKIEEDLKKARDNFNKGEYALVSQSLIVLYNENKSDPTFNQLTDEANALIKSANAKIAVGQATAAYGMKDYKKTISILTNIDSANLVDPKINQAINVLQSKASMQDDILTAGKDVKSGDYDNAISVLTALANGKNDSANMDLADKVNSLLVLAKKEKVFSASKAAINEHRYDDAINELGIFIQDFPKDKEAAHLLQQAEAAKEKDLKNSAKKAYIEQISSLIEQFSKKVSPYMNVNAPLLSIVRAESDAAALYYEAEQTAVPSNEFSDFHQLLLETLNSAYEAFSSVYNVVSLGKPQTSDELTRKNQAFTDVIAKLEVYGKYLNQMSDLLLKLQNKYLKGQ